MISQPDTTEAPPRSTWKIVLLVGLLAATGGWWAYRYWSAREMNQPALTRKPTDFLATWRCLACGAEVERNAGIGPQVCAKCGKNESFTHFRFACATHGVFLVAYNYDQNLDPTQFKFRDGPWQPLVGPAGEWMLRCPTCRGTMIPAESPRQAP